MLRNGQFIIYVIPSIDFTEEGRWTQYGVLVLSKMDVMILHSTLVWMFNYYIVTSPITGKLNMLNATSCAYR